MSLAAKVSQTFSGATYTMELTVPRADLLARAWAGAQDAAGQMKVGRPGTPVLVLPVGGGDPVQVRVGVYHGGSVYDREGRQFQADMRPGGVYVRFSAHDLLGDSQRQAMVAWLAEHGYDSAGEPWAVLAAGGVAEVRWPVRPVRDSESFIGRHGVRVAVPDPDVCLAVDQEIHDRTVEGIPELIGRFEASTARPDTLERIWMEALAAARLAQILTPDDPVVIRWLTLAGRAGLAELTCRATGSPLELELDGRPVAVHTGTSQLLYGNRMIDTLLAALAVADPVAVRLLRDLPLDALRSAPGRPEEYILSRAAALRALSRGDWQARPAVRAVLSASQASADAWGVGPWFSHMEVPVWRLGLALLDGDQAAFTAAQRDALLAHRRWWGHTQANPGELQDHNSEGYASLGATCFAALYVEAGGELTLGSEYVPGCVLDSARQRRQAGPDARAWPGPPDAAAEAEHRRASERDRMLARQVAASHVADQFPDAEPLLEWPHDGGGIGAEPTAPGFRADDLDGVWQRPGPDGPRLIAVSVSGGDHPLPEVVPKPGAPAQPAGTRDYLRLAAERLRADGRAEPADTLVRETLAGRLIYLHVTTDPGGQSPSGTAQPFDISDETMVATLLAAVRTRRYRRFDDLYTPLGEGAARQVIAGYRSMDDLREKEVVQALLYACAPMAAAQPVFRDMVANAQSLTEAREAGVEIDTRVALAMAMAGLEEDRDRFSVLLADDDAFTAALHRHRRTAVPITQSTIGQPAEAGPVAREPAPRAGAGLFRRLRRARDGGGPAAATDISEPVRAALSRGMPRIARRAGLKLEFGTTLGDGLPRVTCRPAQLEEVVTVLLDNAAAAMGRSGRWTLDVRTYSGPGDVVIEVADSGDGVPDTLREKILDPAWLPPRGLLRARTIVVDGLAGSIGFTTVDGRGTTVLVRLPTAAQPAAGGAARP